MSNSTDNSTPGAKKRAECAQPCDTCPWLTRNQGVRHQGGWYTKANLKRLWSGLRRGEQMICHATDPGAVHYGGDKEVAAGHERECVGALILAMRHIKALEAAASLADYRRRAGLAMTRDGLSAWIGTIMWADAAAALGASVTMPKTVRGEGVGVPWDCPVSSSEEAEADEINQGP